MEQSPRLGLSYVVAGQAQKHVTVNETFRRLDALVQLTVKSRTIAAQPSAPVEGDAYILTAAPTGTDWGLMTALHIAYYRDGVWRAAAAVHGIRAYVIDADEMVLFDGSAWKIAPSASERANFGVNATPDATNRLSVKSPSVLLDAETDTINVTLNKAAAANDARFTFQTAFSTRALFGLLGNDDFTLKVTADGTTFHDALIADKDSGKLGLGAAAAIGSAQVSIGGDVVLSGGSRAIGLNAYYDAAWKYTANGYGALINETGGDIVISTLANNAGGAGAAASPQERIRIKQGGNVGIGTDNPTARLAVGGAARAQQIGVNAAPDATNRLSVTTPSALLNAETDTINVTLNKTAAANDARFTFQTGFSTRALFGLLANDDFTLKVSPDGSAFHDAIVVDRNTGAVNFASAIKVGGNQVVGARVVDAALAALTNSTGGTTDGTLAAISGSGADAEINNNFAELFKQLEAMRALIVAHGLGAAS